MGFFLFPIALFPLLALISYRWQAIEKLNLPPEASSNLIGVVGDAFAYNGYQMIGLAAGRTAASLLLGHGILSAAWELWGISVSKFQTIFLFCAVTALFCVILIQRTIPSFLAICSTSS